MLTFFSSRFLSSATRLSISTKYTFFCSYHSRKMSDMSCRVAVLQLTSTSDKLRNREKCHELLCKAKNFGAQAAFLPEAFDFIGESAKQTAELAEELNEESGTVAYFKGITLFYYWLKSLHFQSERHDAIIFIQPIII